MRRAGCRKKTIHLLKQVEQVKNRLGSPPQPRNKMPYRVAIPHLSVQGAT
jgi:hypothetical protein